MDKDFEIGQSNEIIKSGKIYDLHNLYNITGIILDRNLSQLKIMFKPASEYGEGNPSLVLNFRNIDYLEFSLNTMGILGLDEMGYKSPEDRDNNWLMNEQQSTPEDHLFLRLLDGDGNDFIRVHCQKISFFDKDHDLEKIASSKQ